MAALSPTNAQKLAVQVSNVAKSSQKTKSGERPLSSVSAKDIDTTIKNPRVEQNLDEQEVTIHQRNEQEIQGGIDTKIATLEQLKDMDREPLSQLEQLNEPSEAAQDPATTNLVFKILNLVSNVPGLLEGLNKSGVQMGEVVFDSVRHAKDDNKTLQNEVHNLKRQVADLQADQSAVVKVHRLERDLHAQQLGSLRQHLWRISARCSVQMWRFEWKQMAGAMACTSSTLWSRLKAERLQMKLKKSLRLKAEADLETAMKDKNAAQNQETALNHLLSAHANDLERMTTTHKTEQNLRSKAEAKLEAVTKARDLLEKEEAALTRRLSEQKVELNELKATLSKEQALRANAAADIEAVTEAREVLQKKEEALTRSLSEQEVELNELKATFSKEQALRANAAADLETVKKEKDAAEDEGTKLTRRLSEQGIDLDRAKSHVLTCSHMITRHSLSLSDAEITHIIPDLIRLMQRAIEMEVGITEPDAVSVWLTAVNELNLGWTEAQRLDSMPAVLRFWCKCALQPESVSYESLHKLMECLLERNEQAIAQTFVEDGIQTLVAMFCAQDSASELHTSEDQVLLVLQGLKYLQRQQHSFTSTTNSVASMYTDMQPYLNTVTSSILARGLGNWLSDQFALPASGPSTWAEKFVSCVQDCTLILDPVTCDMSPPLYLIVDNIRHMVLIVKNNQNAEGYLDCFPMQHVRLQPAIEATHWELVLRFTDSEEEDRNVSFNKLRSTIL